ncbi:phosphate/phosphite/phosphonate ABC transporter substrate-binding protein [Alkalibacterium olivapovliticus]|uniref:Phosphonate transport system substrate-binding protein n=1 Tax=Alkalibacterium olivapovliticus TaxID=99907 RepID=A0A2T0W5M8_9LACT|nr:phosphate/phosphite/phosphonate ABC transporter substrate-binding protein [Alkalibacterium olivapovliticus]PRY81379.1 phosphonate transport system substrate-binding protein [Alkalibacterium olivapovliticus]
MRQIKGLIMGLSAVLLLGACGTTDTGTEENGDEEIDELVLGYFPSADVENMAASARPLEEYLSEQLDIEVTGQVMTDYTGLIEAMRNQNADVAFLPPFAYVQAEERANVEVLLKAIRDGSESYVAQYNVAADSEFDSIDDLVEAEGLVWAFTDYTSTSGYLFPAQQLMDLGIEDLDSQFTMIDVGAHDSALLSVLDGQADFATTFEDARVRLEDEIPDIYEQIRVIGTTEEIPNATLSVRSELPEELKERIAEAFLNMNDDPEMLEVLKDVYNWEGFAPAQSSDYDVVRDVYSQFEELIEE